MYFIEQKYSFNKNETESKMENSTHIFRETNLQFTQESKIKNKTVMSCSSRKKIFCTVYFARRNAFF